MMCQMRSSYTIAFCLTAFINTCVSKGGNGRIFRSLDTELVVPVTSPSPSTLPAVTPGQMIPLSKQPVTCGQRPLEDIVSSLTPFEDGHALYGEFPWMVAVLGIQYVDGNQQSTAYFCGGSLVRPDVVLTAAHCVKGKANLTIRAGEWSVVSEEPHPVQNRNVHQVTIHELYSPERLHNDIALLFLESPVEMADNVATVCLPEQGEHMENRECMASGWGKDVFGVKGKYQEILKKVKEVTVRHDACEGRLRQRLGQHFKLHESVLCATAPSQPTYMCGGDGGSPLVCPSTNNRGTYMQAGIMSWGLNCGEDIPEAYINVAQFRNWIDNKVSSFKIPDETNLSKS